MKKLLFILMFLVAATATMSAQDEPMEQTAAPFIYWESEPDNGYCTIFIENYEEENAVTYYRVAICDYEYPEYSEWLLYTEPLFFNEIGAHYIVEAYSIAEGKTESEHVGYEFIIPAPTPSDVYDFVKDGLYYYIISGDEVSVVAGENQYTGEVTIPSTVYYEGTTYSVTTIGSYAFSDCYGLRLIIIPASVTTIEANAFSGCYGLSTIYCLGMTPPSATGAFSADPCYYQTTLYVPGEAINNYYSDEVWRQFQNIQGLYQPRATFYELGDELTITVIGLGNLEVYVNGRHAGTGDCILTYKVQRQSSNDFHVSVNVIQHYNGHSNGFYYGYDSRYDSFTTLPLLYANEVEQGQGLKINMISDGDDYYNNYFWNDGFDYVWPEYCYYRINGTGAWTRGEIDDLFYLPEYGDYTIEAYAGAGGDRCANSSTITIDVHYGSDGFYSRYISYLNTHIVYNGLYYSNSSHDNNVTVSLNQTVSYGINLPTLSDIVIPASFTIAGDEYTVTSVSRSNLEVANSITCLSATPIDGYLGEDSDPFFETPLFVPQEGLEAYKAHEQWGKFLNIVPFIGAGPGDINGDGNIAISDVTNLIDMLLGGDELPAWADVDGDGIVGIKDVTTLIDRLLGS